MRKRLTSCIFAILPILCTVIMAACSDHYYADDYRNYDKEFGRETNEDSSTSATLPIDTNLALEGNFNLASLLEPARLDIYSLNGKLERLNSIPARISRNRLDFSYKATALRFPTSLAEFDIVCRYRDSKDTSEMHFTAYAKVSEKNSSGINFYRLLESEYIKKLVQEKGETFEQARTHAHYAIHDMLDPATTFEYGIENAPYGNDTLETLAYHYCLFFLHDSSFYRNFKKLSAAVGNGKKWDDIVSATEISNKLIEYYRLDESQCDSAVYNTLKKDDDWTQLRYSTAIWIVGDTASCDTKKPQKDTSEVADTTAKDTLKEPTVADKFGDCTANRQNQRVKFDEGKYFECKDKEWVETIAPIYYGDYGNAGEYVIYDGQYFQCWGGFEWHAVPEEFVLPPVKDLQQCKPGNYAQYGDKVFHCYKYLRDDDYYGVIWYEFPEDSIPIVQRNGLFCTDSTIDRIEEVDGTYWVCHHVILAWDLGENRYWTKLSFTDSVLYAFNKEHQGDCKSGRTGTTVYWNEAMSTRYSTYVYFLCDDTYNDWGYDYTGIGSREDYEPAVLDGGVFINDSTFVAQHGEYTYTVMRRTGWSRIFDIDNVTASIDGKEYGVLFRNKIPYLSGKRGAEDIMADTLPGKSKSFNSFVEQYTHPESAYPAFHVTLSRMGENSYMDWEHAASFCPTGFHMPDTSEWKEEFLSKFPVDARDAQDSPIKVRYNAKEYTYDIYWTSASKDSDTHYCYEIRYEANDGPYSRTIECPNDIYPGVQTLCFKDEE